AALTTYLSLAGRYCVLMPNTGKGGGISRKIAVASDRRRLKEVLAEMEIPQGMAVIVRTAGSQRTKAEIRRDYDYLLRLWDEIRTTTLESTAPKLIHEEANLIKRAIRDQYARDMTEVLVEGEEGHKAAKAFMKMLMPSHARHVKLYKDEAIPLMHKYQVESQLEAMYSTQVRLKSGGSIVLNQTEALVAIDVNSGKATKERHIEETALKTNLEAAEEVGRQLRLRDLAGLIVIDFIDMEESRHNRDVERRLKEALKSDRARIQLGRISPFGLLELSRQRLRPSLFETSNEACPTCAGTGFIRSKESTCLQLLRAVTEEAIKGGAESISLRLSTDLALYLLNEHRTRIAEIEGRYGFALLVKIDDELGPSDFVVGRVDAEGRSQESQPQSEARERPSQPVRSEDDGDRKRSRRGGRRRKKDDDSEIEAKEEAAPEEKGESAPQADDDEQDDKKGARRRRRGKRGGRRRSKRREESEENPQTAQEGERQDGAHRHGQPHGDSSQEQPDSAPQQAPQQAEKQSGESAEDRESPAADGQDDSEAKSETKSGRGRRRTPRKKAAAKQDAAEPDSAETAKGETAESETADKPEKPKRSRSRKPKAKQDDAKEAESESKAEDKPEQDTAAAQPTAAANEDRAPAKAGSAEASPAPQPADKADSGKDDEKDGQPKRRGWWNRALG
ncbi:MAG: Rne/Rng family ribonuclease, partial [Rhodovibrionaceae bacterium]